MIGYAAETEAVLTRADIDENFGDKANWIDQDRGQQRDAPQESVEETGPQRLQLLDDKLNPRHFSISRTTP